ncbi:MAG: hypothetical protein IKS33_03210 [Bacteroidales bacterium]|nr:hypothetical protein [Bacteroidales bacterium]
MINTLADLSKEILKYRSLAIAGMKKNTGKTETLNYILSALKDSRQTIAVTSIGVDGETTDRVTLTEKPEIVIYKDMLFVTSEKHFALRKMSAEICKISRQTTALGRLITAKAALTGKVMLSGPADTATLKAVIRQNEQLGAKLTIVDGALSRLSLSAPSVTDATILATGAALSANIPQLVHATKYICDKIALPVLENPYYNLLNPIDNGIWTIDHEGNLADTGCQSALQVKDIQNILSDKKNIQLLYVAGAISNDLLSCLCNQKAWKNIVVVVKDFTKIFADANHFYLFLSKGGLIKVLSKTKLLAITINPTSPQGYVLDTQKLQESIFQAVHIPTFNVRTNEKI